MRPKRLQVTTAELNTIGIPKPLQGKTFSDFKDFDDDNIRLIKRHLVNYCNALSERLDEGVGLYLYGANGSGKTLSASIIATKAYAYRYDTVMLTLAEYIEQVKILWGKDKEQIENVSLRRFYDADLLVLDELGKEVSYKLSVPILERILRYREAQKKSTILISNMTLENLENTYGGSVMSLIKGHCLPLRFSFSDRRLSELQRALK